jgi:hypothetical protein
VVPGTEPRSLRLQACHPVTMPLRHARSLEVRRESVLKRFGLRSFTKGENYDVVIWQLSTDTALCVGVLRTQIVQAVSASSLGNE